MVDLRILIILISIAIIITGSNHHPKVYEDDIEYNRGENIRTARNPESTYRTIHQPPVFNFGAAKQQDYLKFKYAEQQKANSVTRVNGMAKSYKYHQPQQFYYKTSQEKLQDAEDWQPFDPKISKLDARHLQEVLQQKLNEDLKLYTPNLLKVNPEPKNFQLSFTDTNIPQPLRGTSNFNITDNDDLAAQFSEPIEQKVDLKRSDSTNEFNKIIFIHPNQLQEHFKENSDDDEKLNHENTDLIGRRPGTQITALNDLIGKNPNVQLEGLKRLLEDNHSKDYNIPTIQGQQQVENKDNTPIADKTVDIPNSERHFQINHGGNTISLQTSHPVDRGSLEEIQKQLDEASKIETQHVLARAQQEAQAQVEAQHKAIALAQVHAQKVALENIKNSIYGNAEALPLIRSNEQVQSDDSEQFHDVVSTPTHTQPQVHSPSTNMYQPILENHGIPISSYSNIIQPGKVEQPLASALKTSISLKQIIPQSGPPSHISVPSRTSTPSALYENVDPQPYGSKELLYYAPHHQHHQAVAQLQAKNALLAQITTQNKALLHNHKNVPSTIRQILKKEQIGTSEAEEDASNIHAVTHSEPQAYQHIVLESKEVEDTADEEKDYDDLDDLQYAAKYAFGYRIKDAKEGNDFGHEERRNGKSLEGSYHVLLPDGRLQKVEYYADKSGYHAKVTYEHSSH